MLAQLIHFDYRVGEISSPTRYFPEASSINFTRSVKYGFGVLATSIQYRAHRMKLVRSKLFEQKNQLQIEEYYAEIENCDAAPTGGKTRL
jgi:hypothetical protein